MKGKSPEINSVNITYKMFDGVTIIYKNSVFFNWYALSSDGYITGYDEASIPKTIGVLPDIDFGSTR